jgi:acyl-coenzyme A thioesterase PaaI-like protein
MTMAPNALSALLIANLPSVDHRREIIEEIGTDFVRMRLPVNDTYFSHDLPPGSGNKVLSGPISLGFAETALYACVHAFYGPDCLATTTCLNTTYFRFAAYADVLAIAKLLSRGKSIASLETHLYSVGAEKPFAHVTATYAIRTLGNA